MKFKKLSPFILGLAAALMLGACGNADSSSSNASKADSEAPAKEIVISHSKGEFKLSQPAKKVVIFDMGILDTVDALETDVKLAVPQSNIPSYLSEYKTGTVNAGGLFEPDMEAIFGFEPDAIIIGARQADFYDQLNEIAPTLYVELNAASFIEDFKKNTLATAEILGVKEKAETKLKALDTQIQSVKTTAQASNAKGLILLTNDGSISAYGLGSRFGIVHEGLGVKAADDTIKASTHGQEASFEYISQVNPDILFVVDRTLIAGGATKASATLDNALVKGTNAAKNDKIVMLDAECWYLSTGGLNATKVMVTEVESALK